MYNEIFIKNVLLLLENQKITNKELSQRANISLSFLSDLFNGKGNPSLRIMAAISEVLKTPLPVLLKSQDLGTVTLEELKHHLPTGFSRVSVILTELQADTARQWDKDNQKIIKPKQAKRI